MLTLVLLSTLLVPASTLASTPAQADEPIETLPPLNVTLVSDTDTFAAGQSVTLTAVANQPLTGTGKLRIFDVTTGKQLKVCTSISCSYSASRLFQTGPPHDYVAEVSFTENSLSAYGTTLDVQATSNTVTVARQAWTVTLTTDKTTFAAGEVVTLTATANQAPRDAGSHYQLRIFDVTTGSQVASCSGASCSYAPSVLFYKGGPHDYVAEVSFTENGLSAYGTTLDVQATSNTVTVARQAWTVTLSGETTTSTSNPMNVRVTLSASANQNTSKTGGNFQFVFVDYTTGGVVGSCGGSGCSIELTLSAKYATHSYVVHIAPPVNTGWPFPQNSYIQASSNGYSADAGHGAILSGENVGGSNASEKACQCAHADPVNTATGEFFLAATDIGIPGAGPDFTVGRVYSTSRAATDGPFGFGWSANFSMELSSTIAGTAADPRPRQVQIVQENGALVLFTLDSSGHYIAPARVLASLAFDEASSQWTFVRQSRQVMVFDDAGTLVEVKDLHGNTVSITYNASGKVAELEASGGRTLLLSWAGNHVTKVTDSAGRTVDYGYDSNGNLTSVTQVDGGTLHYGYNAGHFMTSLTKPGGGVTTNTFDSSQRVTKQVDEAGRTTTFAYSTTSTKITAPDGTKTIEVYSNGQMVSQTRGAETSLAQTTSYEYDFGNNVNKVTDPLGNVTTYSYNAKGHKLSQTDPLGLTTTWTYNLRGDVLSATSPLGRVTTATYNSTGSLLTLTAPSGSVQSWTVNPDGTNASWVDAGGKTSTFTYDFAGRQNSSTDADGRVRSSTFDAAGTVTSTIDPAGKVTSVTSDAAARVLTVTDPNGNTTTYTYDTEGNRTSTEDAAGNISTAVFDLAGQQSSSTNARGKTTTYTYTGAGYVSSVTDPNNHTTTYAYNSLGLLSGVTDANGKTTTLGYDGAGRRATVTLPSGSTSTIGYDAAGRTISKTDGLGNTTTASYNKDGAQIGTTDPLGRYTTTAYTDDGQVEAVSYPDASTEKYTYAASGQLIDFENADGLHTNYTYSDAGLPTSKVEPGGFSTGYAYDAAGQMSVLTKPDGTTQTFSYDDGGRLTRIQYSLAGSIDTTYSYDSVNRRTQMTDESGTNAYHFDSLGNLTSETNGAGATTGYSYDNTGLVTTLTYPGSRTVVYGYDAVGQMTSVTDWAGNESTFSWTDDGQLETQSNANGVDQSRIYDAAGRTAAINTSDGTTALAAFGYTYDAAGQLIGDSQTDPISSSPVLHDYGFDDVSQLARVTTGAATTNYVASSAGLLTAMADGSVLTYNGAEQLTTRTPASGPAVSYGYDANGSRVSATTAGTDAEKTISYAYNPAGALQSVTLPAVAPDAAETISYTSNGDGLRQSRTDSDGTHNFTWQTSSSLPLLLDDGVSSYLYGPSLAPIAQIVNATGAVQYLHSDLIGSTRVITDSAGAAVGTTQYDEYGNRTAHAGVADSEIGFSGNWTDPDTGFVYLRARDYDATTGQFTTVDPAVDTTRQPYAYAANNPLQNVDPTGLDFWGDVGNNALALGAGVLDSVTMGASSWILGSVVPGYKCLTEGNPWFTAGTVVGMVAVGLATAGIGAGVVIASIAARTAIKVAVKTAVSASQRVVTGGVVRAPARLGAAATQAASKSAPATSRIYSNRVIQRMADEPGPMHNFPSSFDRKIFDGGTRTVNSNYFNQAKPNLGNSSIQYRLPGEINGRAGTFEVFTRGSTSGRTELIMHRFFRPDV